MNPKLFISYSWTNQDHEAWIERLAVQLCESGVDVILDKWDLREGHDANAFMERMVSDPEIKKVLIVCNKAYTDKANGRSGGVGTETQIITPEIYSGQSQNKFVAVVTEKDDDGKAYVPIYYKSRIHIDFTDPSAEVENFEKLVRWIYDQPLSKKPEIGSKPAFLSEETRSISLGTSSRHKRAIDAVKNGRANADALLKEYFELFADGIEKFRITSNSEPFDEEVIRSIEGFLPYRNEFIEAILAIALYRDSLETTTIVHRFLEKIIPYLDRPKHVFNYRECDFDNFKFIVHEMFLYALAALIRYERFESAASLFENEYYVPFMTDYGKNSMVSFDIFRQYAKSFEHRNDRLKLNRSSLRADLLKNRASGVGIGFQELMQADFIVFLRSSIGCDQYRMWWPETLVYGQSATFEIFARAKSKSYFDRIKRLLGASSKNDIESMFDKFRERHIRLPQWGFHSISPAELMNFSDLATRP